MRSLIKRLHEEIKTTTIYVTHDQLEAMTLADRIVVMRDGEVEQIGTPKEIYNTPNTAFVAGFVGSPSANLLAGRIENGMFFSKGISLEASSKPNRDKATLGIRPEDISLAGKTKPELRGSVETMEMIGEAMLVTFSIEGQSLIAKLDADCNFKAGQQVSLKTGHRKFFFDGQTGYAI